MKIWISCDGGENDPQDASVNLPSIPRIGEKIEVWNARAGSRNSGSWTGTEHWLEVKDVIWMHDVSDEQATVRVWVGIDGFGHEEMKQIFDALNRDDHPGESFKGPYEACLTPSQRYHIALEKIAELGRVAGNLGLSGIAERALNADD